MNVLDNYLKFLNEQSLLGNAGSFIAKNAAQGVTSTLWFSAALTPAIWLSWRVLGAAFSKARKKCGVFSRGPGRETCIAREQIKILNQKISVLNQIKSKCNTSKNPDLCKEKADLEIEKAQNKIEVNNNKLQEVQESYNLNEQILSKAGNLAKGAAGMGVLIGVGMVVDKALKIALRSSQAVFSQATRKCGVYKTGPDRERCMSKYKLDYLNKQLNLYSSSKNCNKSEKCQNKVEMLKRQIQLQKDNIILYGKEDAEKKREEAEKKAKKLNKI